MRAFPRLSVSLLVFAAACGTADDTGRSLPLSPASSVGATSAAGQVYTATNDPAGNSILAFDRAADGSLTAAGSYATGGVGTGAGLGNQGGVILANGGRVLLVVNAATNDVSSFLVRGNGTLDLVGRWPSGGTTPISVTEANGLVYVLNAGGSGNVTAFRMRNGALTAIDGSSRPLSGTATAPAQAQLSANGRLLVVTEKATNQLVTYVVNAAGLASAPRVIAASGQTPFGFALWNGLAIVSEAFGGAVDGSAVSTYDLAADGSARVLSGSVPTTETAACWLVVTEDGRFAYAANAGSASITGYALSGGRLSILNVDGVTARGAAGIADLAISRGSQFLYARNGGGRVITGYAVGSDGALTPVPGTPVALPAGTNGIAAR